MAEIGWAGLGIVPTFDKFGSELNKGTSKAMLASGAAGGRTFGDSAGRTAGRRFGSVFKTAAKASLVGVAALGVGAFKLGKDSIGLASDLGESLNAINVSYGKQSKAVKALGRESADSLGLSNTEFNNLAVRFSAFSRTIAGGEGRKVVTTLDDLTGRASDFASVMNLDVSEAAELFQSGLAGETEPLRRFGIDLSAAKVEAFAYAEGIAKAGTELTESEKVQARYATLMDQTSRTQGDFADTSDKLANRQRILSARWDDARAKLGQGLLPVIEDVVGFILDKGIPAFEDFADWFNNKGVPAIGNFTDFIKQDVAPAFGDLKGFLGPIGKRILPDIKDAAGDVKDVFKKLAPFVEDAFEAFDRLPDGVKKGLLIGGGALALKKVLGGGGGGVAGAAGGGIASRITNATKDRGAALIADRLLQRFQKPLPVIVVNQGGAGGTFVGANGKDRNGKPRGGGVAKGLGLSAAIPFAGKAIDNLYNNFTDGKNSKLLDQVDNLQALKGALGEVAKARTGISSAADAVKELDRIYAGITMRDPGKGLDKFEAMLNDSELSADDLRKMLPNTAREIDKAGGSAKIASKRTDDWKDSIRGVKQQGEMKVPALFPGLDEAIAKTRTYKGLVESFDGASIRVKGTSGGRFLKGLAAGGPVQRGQTYLVGENGPELFRSNEAGRITPNHQVTTNNPVNIRVDKMYVQDGADLMRRAGRARRGPALGGRR